MKNSIAFIFLFCCLQVQSQHTIYVSLETKAAGNGSVNSPLPTLKEALLKIKDAKTKDVKIVLRKGKYLLDSTIHITPDLLSGHSVHISAYSGEEVILCGAKKLVPAWTMWKEKIMKADIGKGLSIDQLYCNGKLLSLARYPNYDSTKRVFNGTAADAISKERIKTWQNPVGGYVHALHQGEWGGFHYRITGVSATGELQLEGGWQNNRPAPMNKEHRFVENIFEELDAPGEWYYNSTTGILYYYPSINSKIDKSVFEYSALNELLVIKGDEQHAVENITISGIGFTQTNRTFMLTKEPLLRSDWTIYRGGAILVEKAENITINNCSFDQLGGNAIFVSRYNRKVKIQGNEIKNIGASAIAFVGSAEAVRSPSFRYGLFVSLDNLDREPGPKTDDYPKECIAHNNLIHDIGRIEKQVAGVHIDMASEIQVSHNTIYNTPRSGINIGDGCWGGHIIEYNDVFNTVLETGDHGAFNSWGRDRYWLPNIKSVDSMVRQNPDMPFWDAMKPTIMRNNRFHCMHGWDIDLDDGSSNYQIYNNVCLNGGLKLREGYRRVVTNNIIINNSFHPHVWYEKSMDVFKHNIVSTNYAPIGINDWGNEVDSNFFLLKSSLDDARKNNTDEHSLSGQALFADVSKGNYSIKNNSPAFKTGFRNVEMNNFGVISPKLRSKAAKTPIPDEKLLRTIKKSETTEWMGATIKNIETLGERSAAGLFKEAGILILKISGDGLAAKSGLKERDVILAVNGKPVDNVNELLAAIQVVKWQGKIKSTIMRNQKEQEIFLILK